MRWPWAQASADQDRAEQTVRAVRSHIGVLVRELEALTARIQAQTEELDRG